MNTDNYKTFVMLAKTLSFSKSAEQLNVVQSTVSSRINELEKYLDQVLFKRTKRSVELTHAGKIFLPHAEKLLRHEQLGLEKLKTMHVYEDKLKICIIGSLYREKLSEIINDYYQLNPEFELDIEFRITELQLDMLHENEIDIGFINRKTSSRKIEVRPFMDYNVILVAPIDYPIADEISADDLRHIDFALSSSNSYLQEWYMEIMPDNFRPRLRINSTVQMVEYVKKGYGCAFLQDFLVKKEIEQGLMKPVKVRDIKPLKMTSYIAINKSRRSAEAVKRFLDLIESTT